MLRMSCRLFVLALLLALLVVVSSSQVRAGSSKKTEKSLAQLEEELAKLRKTEASLGQKLINIEDKLAASGFPVAENESVRHLLPPDFTFEAEAATEVPAIEIQV